MAKKSDVSCFPAGNVAKIPLSPILRYFDAGYAVVASEALLGPLTTGSGRLKASENGRRKKLHTRPITLNPRRRFVGIGAGGREIFEQCLERRKTNVP